MCEDWPHPSLLLAVSSLTSSMNSHVKWRRQKGIGWQVELSISSLHACFPYSWQKIAFIPSRLRKPKYNDIDCYTDGSHMNGHTGTGCYIVQHQYKPTKLIIPLGKVYQAKMLRTYAVTMELVTRKVRDKKVIIFKDNQALIHALNAIRSRSKLVIDCVNTFNVIGKKNHVLLVWVPNHAGIESNGRLIVWPNQQWEYLSMILNQLYWFRMR